MKNKVVKLSILTVLLTPISSYSIDLETYLNEVAQRNGAVRGSQMSYKAKELRLTEGSLFFRPAFFLSGEYYDDQRPTNAPGFQGSQTLRHTVRTGLQQNWKTGTKASISYNYYKTEILGASPSLLPNNLFVDIAPTIEVTQSLWRNFLGSEFKAQEALTNSQASAQKWNEQFNFKNLMVRAENAYWRLFFAQESLEVQTESLERAKRLRDWNSNRVRQNLVDENELLQAEANLQNREMEYQDTITEIDSAQREFNSIRESDGDVVLKGSGRSSTSDLLTARAPKKMELREDVLAALATQKVAIANSELGTQRNRPNLELYGSYSINGRDKKYSESYDMAVSATRPFSIIGIRFTTPLDLSSMSDYKRAYAQEVSASELNYKRKVFETEKEWEILVSRFENFKKRYVLSQKLEKVQEKKLFTEKKRYNQGRTTTFQVLQFEQDFANAQLLKLRNERDLITVYNQLKLFSGDLYE